MKKEVENNNKGKMIKRTKDFKENFYVFLKRVLILLIVISIGIGVLYLYQRMSRSPLFSIKEVLVEGVSQAHQEDIVKIMNLPPHCTLFRFDPVKMMEKLSKIPWIESVYIRKELPNTISIKVKERKPFFILISKNLFYVDKHGIIFKKLSSMDNLNFPVLTGITPKELKERNKEKIRLFNLAVDLFHQLKRKKLLSPDMISEVHLDPIEGLSLCLVGSGLWVRLGKEKFDLRLKRFVKVLNDLKKRGIKPLYIDTDYSDKVVLKIEKGERNIKEQRGG